MSVVTIELAREHLNVIGTEQDSYIQQCIDAAERYAAEFLGRDLEPWSDADSGSSESSPPADVVQAILLLVGDFFALREAQVAGPLVKNPAAEALLHFHRRGLGI